MESSLREEFDSTQLPPYFDLFFPPLPLPIHVFTVERGLRAARNHGKGIISRLGSSRIDFRGQLPIARPVDVSSTSVIETR